VICAVCHGRVRNFLCHAQTCAVCGQPFCHVRIHQTCSSACSKELHARLLVQQRQATLFNRTCPLCGESTYGLARKTHNRECVVCGCRFCHRSMSGEGRATCSCECHHALASCRAGATRHTRWPHLSREEQLRVLTRFSYEQNQTEKRLQSLCPASVEFVGDHKFWVTLDKGVHKNPDFVVRPFRSTRRVIELFGDHWHSDREEANRLVQSYREVGVECLVVWEFTLKEKPLRTQRLIHEFVSGTPGDVL
jgi:G:T-mismatch repair DNA endonuclease (very short patch repair protein)